MIGSNMYFGRADGGRLSVCCQSFWRSWKLGGPRESAFLRFAISVALEGKDQPTGDEVLGLDLPDIDQVKDVIVKPALNLSGLRLHEKLGVDLEPFECRLLASSILASSCKSLLVPTGKQQKAHRRKDIREAVTEPVCKMLELEDLIWPCLSA